MRRLAVAAAALGAAAVPNPEEYANTVQGTASITEYSTGGTLPLVGRPWGMTNWAPQTADLVGSGGRWFNPEHRRFFGVRCTHQPSPWIGDYGYFWITTQVGKQLDPGTGFGGYDPRDPATHFRPYLFNTTVFMFDTTVAVTATERSAVLQFRFPELRTGPVNGADQRRRIMFVVPDPNDWVEIVDDEVFGWTHSNSGGVHRDFRLFFAARISRAPADPVMSFRSTRLDCGAGTGNLAVQIQELTFWKDGNEVSTAKANASNPGGNSPAGEGPASAIDGKNDTKWLDFARQPLDVRFPAATAVDAVSFTTADDAPERDPVRWALDGSTDGLHWEQLAIQDVDYPTPTQRRVSIPSFELPQGTNYRWYRFRTLKVRAQQDDNGCGVSIAEFSEGDPGSSVVEVSVGTSYISVEQARANLLQEVGNKNFETVLAESKAEWRRILSRVNVTETGLESDKAAQKERLGTFYGSLYHAAMFPHRMTEYVGGVAKHYSPYTGNVHDGFMSTDHGFWDAYRTVYPLHNLIFADVAGELLQGFVNAYHEGGWLPAWPSPGYRASMVGTFQDLVLADAMVKGITGFDKDEAYAGMLQDADTQPPYGVTGGRQGLDSCVQLGYCAHGSVHEAVARTLNYAFADFGIAQAAKLLGHGSDHDRLLKRSKYYKNVFDPQTKFNRPRWSNGTFVSPFDQYAWGGDFTEGGAWTFRLEAVWDIDGMAELFGGKDALCDKVEEMLAEPPRYTQGGYATQIHEQVELPLQRQPVPNAENFIPFTAAQAVNGFGQYEHNNQPSHHLLYVAAAAGCHHVTEYWARQVMDKLYSSTHFCGDEDNGEMSAWYVFSSLGFYPLLPGTDEYMTGSPLNVNATLNFPSGKKLVVVAHGNSKTALYVSRIALNGEEVQKGQLSYRKMQAGGTLEFWMSDSVTPPPPGRVARIPPHLQGARWPRAAEAVAAVLSQPWVGWAAFACLAAWVRCRPDTRAKASPVLDV